VVVEEAKARVVDISEAKKRQRRMYARPGLGVASSRTTPPAKAKHYVETSRARPFPTSKEARPQRTKASHYNSNTTPSPHPPHHIQQSFYASPAIVAGSITYHHQTVRLYPLLSPYSPLRHCRRRRHRHRPVWLLQTLSPRAPHRSHGRSPTTK
jgi:hypothetical protein